MKPGPIQINRGPVTVTVTTIENNDGSDIKATIDPRGVMTMTTDTAWEFDDPASAHEMSRFFAAAAHEMARNRDAYATRKDA